CSSFAGTNVLF
nr:immunoglobulin light chain junction region [Macaca mulatta]MPO03929.1 immunoglobulin light chain junction region [Macaca mulatta]MPO04546.1 immunoglobulin light chain junction region [Macaca mulatta]MPO05431.1 immunoglobulin light chain junction region [Macaca mulatta]MPO05473.1 immunoglobulin light chain junction region [Macaca mulatta]